LYYKIDFFDFIFNVIKINIINYLKMIVHGYYSAKQHEYNKIAYEYQDGDGNIVLLSEVSPYKRTGDELTKFFKDNCYKGEFVKYIRQVKSYNYVDKRKNYRKV